MSFLSNQAWIVHKRLDSFTVLIALARLVGGNKIALNMETMMKLFVEWNNEES